MAITQEERTALALAALGEITDPNDVGELLGLDAVEDGVVDVRFACRLSAYTGWHWTVSTSDLPDDEMTVLEVELLPGDGALLAPPWLPWTERLAEWRRQHPDEEHPDKVTDLDEDAELDEDDDDLAADDGLDELDETELEGVVSPEESEQDSGDVSDEDDPAAAPETDEDADDDTADEADEDWDEDVRGPRPGEVDRGL